MGTPLKKVSKDFLGQKLRTLIVVISIMVGVFAISGIGTMSATITKVFVDLFDQSNAPDITIMTSAPAQQSLVNGLGQIPNVASSEGRTVFQTRMRVSGAWHAANIVGISNFANMQVGKIPLKGGAFPHAGQILVDINSTPVLSASTGQKIQVSGAKGTQSLTMSGIGLDATQPPPMVTGITEAFMRLQDLNQLAGVTGVNEILIKMKNFDNKDATANAVRSKLQQNHVVLQQFVVRDPNHFAVLDTFKTLTLLLTIFGIVALVLSGMLVINTMNIIISEQTPQIGTMKAVGAKASQIIRTYVTLGFLYGICGTLLGLVLGIVGAYLLVKAFASQSGLTVNGIVISIPSVIEGVGVGVGVTLIASLIPVWAGSRITVREAISSYGLGTGYKPSKLDALIGALGFLPRPARMSVRNTFRRRARLVLTLAPLALAGAMLIAIGSLATAMSNAVNSAVGSNRADLVEILQAPGPIGTVNSTIKGVSGVAAVERWLQVPLTIAGKDNVTLFGVPAHTNAYHYQLRSGRWLLPSDKRTLVLGEGFARDNHLSVGSTVTVRAPRGDSAQWKVVGTVNDLSNNGSLAFAPRQAMATMLHFNGLTNYLLVTTRQHADAFVKGVGDRLTGALFPLHVQPRYTKVADLSTQVKSQYTIFTVLFYVIVALVSIVGALGLFAVLSMNVVERRKEIGVMRSIGASSKAVIAVFGIEALAIGLIAFIVAVLAAIPVTVAFTGLISKTLIQISFLFVPLYVAVMLVFMMVIAALASILPSSSAARLRIAEVLRYG